MFSPPQALNYDRVSLILDNCGLRIGIMQCCKFYHIFLNFSSNIGIFDMNTVLLVFDYLRCTIDIIDARVSRKVCFSCPLFLNQIMVPSARIAP